MVPEKIKTVIKFRLMKIKNFLTLFLFTCCVLLTSCNVDGIGGLNSKLPSEPIIVLYENDVHCEVDGYPKLVSIRKDCLSASGYVSLVSCGDFASGGFIGAISKRYNKYFCHTFLRFRSFPAL